MAQTHHFRQGIKNLPEICIQHGISKVVISPGSRNVPLVIAFTAHPQLECLSITDERSAAYFALGMAQQTGEAVALVCTSGTAVLNFAPAIAEAYYQNLPLVVFTADRPAELIDQADGQTIRQTNIYQNYVKANFELPVETVHTADLAFSDRIISQAIDTALTTPCGPVHINVPMREPIYTALPESHSNPRIIHTVKAEVLLTPDCLQQFQTAWKSYNKKLILIGIQSKNEALNNLVNQFANEPDTVVIAENLSNISGERIITTPEALFSFLNKNDKAEFTPDLLITIGHSVICKQLKIFLRTHKPAKHWQLESSLPYVDTYQSLQSIISSSAVSFLGAMPLATSKGNFAELYQNQKKESSKRHENFVKELHFSDWLVVKKLLASLPKDAQLQIANSTPIRITQLFQSKENISYFCNRGTSGIDGSLSTAAGAAYASKKNTIFLTGDLSFIYDSNGLWNNYLPKNLKIIVLNNNGGNIFRLIGNSNLTTSCENFFTTPHQVKIKALTEAFGVNYLTCEKEQDLSSSLEKLYAADTCSVLEIKIDPEVNTELYKSYFKQLAD